MRKDYLAIIRLGGGTTIGRDKSIFGAVESGVQHSILDFHDAVEGMKLDVHVFDVTGRTALTWDGQSVCCSAGETVEMLKVVTVQLPELTGRMKITGPKYLSLATYEVAKVCSGWLTDVLSDE